MHIRLLAVGKCKGEEQQLVERYLKRLTLFKVSIHEIDDKYTVHEQGQRLIKAAQGSPLWLWDSRGVSYSSEGLATQITSLGQQHKVITMAIGGAHGFSDEVYRTATGQLSLSAMTFPHQMVRVLVMEQIYRSQCIQKGHPYHH